MATVNVILEHGGVHTKYTAVTYSRPLTLVSFENLDIALSSYGK